MPNQEITNYDEIAVKFTDDYIKGTYEYGNYNEFKSVGNENGKHIDNARCSYGAPVGVENVFKELKVYKINTDEIIYTVTINQQSTESESSLGNQYQMFAIKKVNDIWKVNYFIFQYVEGLE